jgi:hypothetical protein
MEHPVLATGLDEGFLSILSVFRPTCRRITKAKRLPQERLKFVTKNNSERLKIVGNDVELCV